MLLTLAGSLFEFDEGGGRAGDNEGRSGASVWISSHDRRGAYAVTRAWRGSGESRRDGRLSHGLARGRWRLAGEADPAVHSGPRRCWHRRSARRGSHGDKG